MVFRTQKRINILEKTVTRLEAQLHLTARAIRKDLEEFKSNQGMINSDRDRIINNIKEKHYHDLDVLQDTLKKLLTQEI